MNSNIVSLSAVLKLVTASAAEEKRGALLIHTKEAQVIRLLLAKFGQPQSPTPIYIDNTTAIGIVNSTIKRQCS